jgi:hypothetical protein
MTSVDSHRAGSSLLELVLVLGLLFWVFHGVWSSLVVHRDAGTGLAERAQDLESIRTVSWLLSEEVSKGRPGIDWEVGGHDSLSLRSFRGLSLVNPVSNGRESWVVCYRGLRDPDPAKDSVLVLGRDGGWRIHDLTNRVPRPDECLGGGEGRVEVWTLYPVPSAPVLFKLFERGTYHLTGKALRYSRGRSGRQPLTPERIEDGRFDGSGEPAAQFAWIIMLEGGSGEEELPGSWDPTQWRGGSW